MTQEEKELLIKDLSTRLPYGVKCNVWYGPKSPALNEKDKYIDDILETINPQKGICTFHTAIGYDFGDFPVEHVKPYLRPMLSMTEEEKEELRQEHIKDEKLFAECLKKAANGDSSMRGKVVPHFAADWCNKNHFDYRGLIPIGLALEAPEEMYKKD